MQITSLQAVDVFILKLLYMRGVDTDKNMSHVDIDFSGHVVMYNTNVLYTNIILD